MAFYKNYGPKVTLRKKAMGVGMGGAHVRRGFTPPCVLFRPSALLVQPNFVKDSSIYEEQKDYFYDDDIPL